MNRKRKNDMSANSVHKKPNIIDWNNMISASSVKNYMLDDPLIDWLKHYNITSTSSIPTPRNHNNITHNISNNIIEPHTKFIMEQGVEFEKNVIEALKIKKPDITIKQISFKNDTQSIDHHNMTLDAMMKGIPIIYQGVLHCIKNNIYGSPDLLIRSDMMKEIFNIDIMNRNIKAPLLNAGSQNNFHYVVVDIKHSTITLNCNKEYIRNTNHIPAYKGQIYLYNMMLESIQGYMPRYGFILGKKITYTKNRETFDSYNIMNNIAIIDYKKHDKKMVNKILSAIEWIRELRSKGGTWHILPEPSRVELYPNMKNDKDGIYRKFKSELAKELGEITSIWWCGYERRMMAHHKKIYSWKDKRLTAEMMGFSDTKTAHTIDMILDINRRNKELIRLDDLRRCIDKRWLNFGNDIIEFYIDFETIARNIGQLTENDLSGDFIFMVGIGWVENDIWMFKNFVVERLEDNCEHNMIKEMWEFIEKMMIKLNKSKCIFIHYTNAEVVFYNKFKNKSINNNIPNIMFYDMYKLFLDNNVVIKGAFNFSLKTIGNAMYENKMIETCWDSNSICSNGLQAMFLAYEQYMNGNITDVMDMIVHYNHIDCKIMWEIMRYIRNMC
jgi:hypothetical protein